MFVVRACLAIILASVLVPGALLLLAQKETKGYTLATPRKMNNIAMPWGYGSEAQWAELKPEIDSSRL